MNDETWIYPLSWSILNINETEDYFQIQKFYINDIYFETNIITLNGMNYRIIFELWIFDENTNKFLFGWKNKNEYDCVWNQIWFNVTSI
jgi:hypothetical protein